MITKLARESTLDSQLMSNLTDHVGIQVRFLNIEMRTNLVQGRVILPTFC